MPIAGLTDRLRIPRLGKLRLGVKAVNAQGKEYPKAVDYFVSDNDEFHKLYGDQPKAIEIAFPTDHSEDWASQFYRAYSRTRGLVCKGGGVTANRMVGVGDKQQRIAAAELKDTEWVDLPCPGRECSYYQQKQCRELMMLQFLLPRISGLGIWQLDTSSINSILNINSAVALLKNVLGKVALLPLTLRVVPIEVSPDGKKKTVYVLQLDIPVRLADLGGQLLLPAAEDETPELDYPTTEEEAARDAAEEAQPGPAPKPAVPVPSASTEPSAREQHIAHWRELAGAVKAQGVPVIGITNKTSDADIEESIADLTRVLTNLNKKSEPEQAVLV